MRRIPAFALMTTGLVLAGASLALAQRSGGLDDATQARRDIGAAESEARTAAARGARLEAEARSATEAAERTAREAAALAARIQQAEAGIAAAEGRLALIGVERRRLDRRLAERREPLVRLTGALQLMARRPLALSALRPGSLRETVYLRAMLETTIPEVRRRTAALRAEIGRGEALAGAAESAIATLRTREGELASRRQRLAAIESRQRLESRAARGAADREAERALALAEEARDLDALVASLDEAGALRTELAALPGPMLRPSRPGEATAEDRVAIPVAATGTPAGGFQLPVAGRTVTGFGEASDNGVRSSGISIAPREGALVVAPAAGRVAFAGPYRGYGRIVIIEHEGGWTSLVTGLARADANVGDQLVAGAPLGIAGSDRPVVTLELRRGGEPVNPLDHMR